MLLWKQMNNFRFLSRLVIFATYWCIELVIVDVGVVCVCRFFKPSTNFADFYKCFVLQNGK